MARWVRAGAVVALAASAAGAAPAGGAVKIRLSRAGFEPARVTLRAGESAEVLLTTGDVEHCFAVDELRVEKRVVPGRPTRAVLVPPRPGEFAFYCCLESGRAAEVERGVLVVVE